MRLLKLLVVLLILALGGLAGYAYLGDMDANPSEMRKPVALDLGSQPAATAPVAETAPAPATTNAPAEADDAKPDAKNLD